MGKGVFKNTIYLNIKTVISTIVGLYSTRLILNALGSEDFGVYGTVAGAIALFSMFSSALTVTTQRFMTFSLGKGNVNEQKVVFTNTIILHVILGLIIVAILESLYYPMFHGIINIPDNRVHTAKLIYQFMCFSSFFTIITVPFDALINAHEDFLYYSIVGIIESTLRLGVAFLITYCFVDKLFFYGLLLALISVSLMIIMRVYCKRKYIECEFSLSKYYNKMSLLQITKFALWQSVGSFAGFFGSHCSNLLLNHYFGTIVIAAKSIGDQVASQLYVVSSNMMRAFNPVIVKAESEGNTEYMLELSMKASRFGYMLYLVFAIPFCFSMPFLLEIWLKNVPKWAVLFCQLQIIRMLLEQITTPLYTSLVAKGNIRIANLSELFFGVATFFLLWIVYLNGGGPQYHYYVSILLLVVAVLFVRLFLCMRICGLVLKDYFLKVLLPCAVASIITCWACYALMGLLSGVYLFLANCLACLVLIYVFGFNKSERTYLYSKILNVIKK